MQKQGTSLQKKATGMMAKVMKPLQQHSHKKTALLRKIKKNQHALAVTLALSIIIGLALFIRAEPAAQPFADPLAENAILIQIQQDIIADISTQYPELPEEQLLQAASTAFRESISNDTHVFRAIEFLENRPIIISEEREALADAIRELYRDENNIKYLPDIDTYYWLAYAENVVERGGVGYENRNGTAWDSRQLAPEGRGIAESEKLHPYFLAYSWRVLDTIHPLTLREAAALYPLFVVALTLLLVFLIGKKIGGSVSGLVASLLLAINPSYTGRTLWGRIDTDAWVIFFSALVIWLVLESLLQKQFRTKVFAAVGAGLAVGLYSITWNAWQYIFWIASISIGGYIAYLVAIRYKEWKQVLKEQRQKGSPLMMFGIFLASSAFFLILLNRGIAPLLSIVQFLDRAATLKSPVLETLWPNVLTTVAELGGVSTAQFIAQVTGFLVFFALCGILFVSTRQPSQTAGMSKNEQKYWMLGIVGWWFISLLFFVPAEAIDAGIVMLSEPQVMLLFLFGALALYFLRLLYLKNSLPFASILLFIWLAVTFYAGLGASRFLLLFSLPLSISAGVFISILATRLMRWVRKELHLGTNIAMIGALIVVVLLFSIPFNSYFTDARSIAQREQPIIDDAWFDALKAIEANSEEDAIITSWWDFGHQFKQVTGRRVTFDGATQDTPQAHWVGRFFMEQNETKAHGILRMLNCGGNAAFDELQQHTQSTIKSVDILEQLLGTSKEQARFVLLREGIEDTTAESILQHTHCTPSESFVVASSDMISKSGVWAHFGSWNFTRAAALQSLRTAEDNAVVTLQAHGFSEEEAGMLIAEVSAVHPTEEELWLAPWPSYRSEAVPCTIGEIISCQNRFQASTTGEVISSGDFDPPALFSYYEQTSQSYVNVEQNREGASAVTVSTTPQGRAFAVSSDVALAGSMFTRMFFEEGTSLQRFDLLAKEQNILGTTVYVWQAKW